MAIDVHKLHDEDAVEVEYDQALNREYDVATSGEIQGAVAHDWDHDRDLKGPCGRARR